MHWAASPLYQFDCFSPGASNMSFTMSSPPCQLFQSNDPQEVQQSENISSEISPSIFSPKERTAIRHPKKRDLYQEPSNNNRNIISGTTEKISPASRSESRGSLDLPTSSAL